jgi:SM-20-related protein
MTISKKSEELISSIVTQINNKGYAMVSDFLSPENIRALNVHAQQLKHEDLMHLATTGQKGQVTNLRGDSIYWIEEREASDVEQIYLNLMHELQTALNQAFFLGLFELESHFAIYPPGSGYQKHLDQFIGQEDRKISAILYLNEDWENEDGGQLRIYLDKRMIYRP